MVNSLLDQIKFQTQKQKAYYNQSYLRRAVVQHCFTERQMLFPFIKTQIKETYGAGAAVGPFSVKTYLEYILTDRNWCDAIFLSLVSSLWGCRISVVRSDSCKTIDYRHDGMSLDKVDFVLLFNCDIVMGHYNSTIRLDDLMTTASKLTRAKGFVERVDKRERVERGYDDPKGGKGGEPKGGKGDGGKKPGDGGDGGGGGLGTDQVGVDKSRLEELEKFEARFKELEKERKELEKERENLKKKLEDEKKKAAEAQKKAQGDDDGFGGTKRLPVGSSSESERELPEETQRVKKNDKRCEVCQITFDNSAALKRHVSKYHKNKYRYKCGKCNRGFMNKLGYRYHQTQHQSGRKNRLDCVFPGCDKTFGSKRALNTHCNETHNPNPKLWKCRLCNKNFDQKRYLDQHYIRCPQNQHKPEYFCEICGTGPFRTPGRVLQHKRAEHRWA